MKHIVDMSWTDKLAFEQIWMGIRLLSTPQKKWVGAI